MSASQKRNRIVIVGLGVAAFGCAALFMVSGLDLRSPASGMFGVYVGWANVFVLVALLAYMIIKKVRGG